jgi:hypothetical protein
MSLRGMVWDDFIIQAERLANNRKNITFDNSRQSVFLEYYEKYRSTFLNDYMKNNTGLDSVAELDRHKNAAVIVCALIDAAPLSRNGQDFTDSFIANETIAVNIALSYMFGSLKKLLSSCKTEAPGCNELGLNKEELTYILDGMDDSGSSGLTKFCLPKPFSAPDEDYPFVMVRDIFFAKEQNKLFHVTLANIFFLIESFSIESLKKDYYKQVLINQLDLQNSNLFC